MLRAVWNLAFKTSSKPYANPQRKNRIVTRVMGYMDCLTVRAAAPVRPVLFSKTSSFEALCFSTPSWDSDFFPNMLMVLYAMNLCRSLR